MLTVLASGNGEVSGEGGSPFSHLSTRLQYGWDAENWKLFLCHLVRTDHSKEATREKVKIRTAQAKKGLLPSANLSSKSPLIVYKRLSNFNVKQKEIRQAHLLSGRLCSMNS